MKIALDYDQTYTLCPNLWDDFIDLCLRQGFEVRIVTARNPVLDKIPPMYYDIPIEYCDGVAKRFHCTWFADNGNGWIPDVYIDDRPESIIENSTATRESLERWRSERECHMQIR